jgi:APA family basic amino acid/polyamine antiporter
MMPEAPVENTIPDAALRPTAGESRLARELGTWSATAVVVGAIIGSGIFRVPGPVAAQAGTAGSIVLLWLLGGAIALCGALSLAELATAFPRTGGMYVFLRETYGRWAAFLFGWAMLVVNPAAYAFVALIFAESLAVLVPALEGAERIVAAVSLIVLIAINIRPVRVGAVVLNATTWLKVGLLLAISIAAIALTLGSASGQLPRFEMTPRSWPGFGLALILVMGAYDGWQWVPQLAGEMKNPARSLPRALGFGVLIVIAVYLIANAANLFILTPAALAESTLVTADVARSVAGAAGASLVAALILVSTFGSNHSGMMTDPRVFFAMAQDGLFFHAVAAVHPRHRTPWVAVTIIGAGGIVYLFVRSFEQLVGTLILGMWPFLALSVAAVIVQRRRRPDLLRPFRVPLYPWVPLFFLLACVGIFGNSLREQPLFTVINIAVIAAGLPVYWLWRRSRGDGIAS